MKTKRGAAVLSVLLYAQGLLGIAALAAVLMKEPAHVADAGNVEIALNVAAR